MSTRYRKLPVEIDAMLWLGISERSPLGNASDIIGWVLDNDGTARWHEVDELSPVSQQFIAIDTLEGTMRAKVGDYIIRGVKGEFYPCDPEIFEMTYEQVDQ